MPDIIYKDESYQIIGACMEVYNELGCGFLEAVYQEALAIEFEARGIPFGRELDLAIQYKQRQLSTTYRADFVVFDKIILEIKAAESLVSKNESQVLNYLNATKQSLGILVNFGSSEGLQSKRFVI
ncbi:MAG: GxxExxY protein [Candidatus Azotimanducaceae bacterium]|jgi:GxxExxY protein